MAVVFSWAELAELRQQGYRPSLRMFVTTDPTFARRMTWVGCVAVLHRAGEPMPVELLHGLDVILDVGRCARAESVMRLIRERNVVPERLQVWCGCDGELSIIPRACAEAPDAWLGPPPSVSESRL